MSSCESVKSVSVVIACRNGMNYLAEAVAGLQRQLVPMEIIVVDDGSTDDSCKLARDLGCIVYSIPHSGLSAARNVGLRHCQGHAILFHDHDDVMRECALCRLVDALESESSPDVVMAQAQDFISAELDEAEKSKLSLRPTPYYGLLSGAVLFRRHVFDIIDNFSENLSTSQTLDILTKTEQAGFSVLRLPFVAVDRRLHNSNMGRTMQGQEYMDSATLLRQRLATLRKGSGRA